MSTPFQPIQPVNLSSTAPVSNIANAGKSLFAEEGEGSKFENIFSNYLNVANQALTTAKDIGDKVATGDLESIHKMSVAGMKAEIMLKLTTQIAAKLSSTCTTLFQMQM